MRLLLIEDDRLLGEGLRDYLRSEGHVVDWCSTLAQVHSLASEVFDAWLVDWQLPDGSGLQWLHNRRLAGERTPALMLTARDRLHERVQGLDAGADDYLVKPFSLAELLARMRVALRHRGAGMRPAVLRYLRDALAVDLERREVLRAGAPVHLTPTEYALLARLVRSAGRVVTHRQLLADVWGAEHVDHTHYLRLYMAQLRAKLEVDPAEPALLLTEPGVGYRVAEPSEPAE